MSTQLLEGSAGILTPLENKVSSFPAYQAQLLKIVAEKKAVLTEVGGQQDHLHLTKGSS